ncbi:hypothetical protein KUCAC02_018499 [Chaenocephalus aceratus]|uniref:Uncharacterized protein n=1 Tax=Chaenocephalus aceratus TaxID=36190 RepID=A0ACB9W8M5_CHAAC|nr:hypothetical protein KUCAC02_018499 [Chaenocephalus aceratus]
MASLYQRFTGKINTANSFPHPPEASHLLVVRLQTRITRRRPLSHSAMADLTSSIAKKARRRMRIITQGAGGNNETLSGFIRFRLQLSGGY